MFGMEKLEWCGYRKVSKFEDMFSHFDTIPVWETDRTDILWQH